MRFSIKAILLASGFVSIWLGAILARWPVGLELASIISVTTIFLALPLAIFDANTARRPFWAAYFATGSGFFVMVFLGLQINHSSDSFASFVSNLPGANQIPERTTSEVVPVHYLEDPGRIGGVGMQAIATSITIHDSVKTAFPFLLAICISTIGGTLAYAISRNRRSPQISDVRF